MAEVIKGLGVVWSTDLFKIDSTTTAGNTGTFASGKVQSVSYEHGADKAEVKGDDGEVKSVIFSNVNERITVEVVPTGTTIALAVASNVLPAIGADVTIVDTGDSELNAAVFMYESGSKRRTVDGAAVLTMNLVRYGLATMSTAAAS